MRPISRKYDDDEHDAARASGWTGTGARAARRGPPSPARATASCRCACRPRSSAGATPASTCACPTPALGGSAVAAAGTNEQKERFLSPFRGDGPPIWGAMAITEPGAGSDAAAIETTASLDGDEWVLNGTKIFCTAGEGASTAPGGFVVVWATVDKSAGRGGIKSFVVPAGTPGMTLVGLEKKLGIRASDTATLRFEDCRIPQANLLGSAEVRSATPRQADDKGFKGAMATFDASRPIVAAMAVGVGRAALDFLREELARQGVRRALRRRAHRADGDRARRDRDGGRAPGGAAAHLARGRDDEPRATQQPRGLDGQGQGRSRRHADHAEGGRAARARAATRRSCSSRSGCATPRSTTSTRARSRSTS